MIDVGDTLSYIVSMSRSKKQMLTEVVSMRLSERDKFLLDEVSELTPFLARLTIARYALRYGLMTMKSQRGAQRILKEAGIDV